MGQASEPHLKVHRNLSEDEIRQEIQDDPQLVRRHSHGPKIQWFFGRNPFRPYDNRFIERNYKKGNLEFDIYYING